MQQIFKNRLSQKVKVCIDELLKENPRKDLKKVKASLLIKKITTKKGTLGKMLLKNLNLNINKKENIYVPDLLIQAFQLAMQTNNHYVGTEHIIYSYINMTNQSKFKKISTIANENEKNWHEAPDNSLNNPEIFGEINALIGNFLSSDKQSFSNSKFLKQFCTDLNYLAEIKNHILVGRTNELERISNTLGRKMKNNPVLVGEPGVGETAIVEGLAKKINQKKAPYYLNNKKIFSLDLGLMVAGTNFRGEFENRLKEVVNEAKQNRNVILFIDEIHNLIGAGSAVGGMDAANLLKPALSRGEIQIIGATTFDEYHKYIEKDAALERRLQPIIVDEPSEKETLKILQGIKKNYEQFHQVEIKKSALESASSLAKKYISNRFLPDSAIDLIDETSARIRSKSKKHSLFDKLQERKNRLEEIIEKKENLVLTDQYEEAIRVRKVEKDLETEIKKIKEKINQGKRPNTLIDSNHIRQTLAESQNLPLELLDKDKKNIPLAIKKSLKSNLYGQNHIIDAVYNPLVCQFSCLANNIKPLGSFLFLGPSGVGKTHTSKIISEIIAPEKKENLIQINMSEFMEKHSVSRLLGAPAGYVGYEEGGEFLERIRKNPYSVVLFDEIEKADTQVLNILLQILDEGMITNAKGQIINFKNTIIILTSNIGCGRLNKLSQLGFETNKKSIKKSIVSTKENIQEELEEILSAELLNRLDDILFFNPLPRKTIEKIVKNNLNEIKKRLKQANVSFEYGQNVIKEIGLKCVNFQQGARAIHRQIKKEIEPLIAENILAKKEKNNKIILRFKNNRFVIERE